MIDDCESMLLHSQNILFLTLLLDKEAKACILKSETCSYIGSSVANIVCFPH